jgi:hypothetical protein
MRSRAVAGGTKLVQSTPRQRSTRRARGGRTEEKDATSLSSSPSSSSSSSGDDDDANRVPPTPRPTFFLIPKVGVAVLGPHAPSLNEATASHMAPSSSSSAPAPASSSQSQSQSPSLHLLCRLPTTGIEMTTTSEALGFTCRRQSRR